MASSADAGTRPPTHPRFSVADVVAGVSVALVLMPQSMAYADLAGLPSFMGLFASALPPILAAPFASSPYLQTGPVALTSLLTFGALSTLEPPYSDDYIALAILLAFVVGVARVLLGLGRLGWVTYLMTQPVLLGFTTAATILIASSQLPKALGVVPEADGVLGRALWSLAHPNRWEAEAVGLSIMTLTVMLGGRKVHRLFPGVLVAVIAGLVYSKATGYSGATVGDIPAGLPDLSLGLEWGRLGSVVVPGLIIALVGYAEPASISRTFAEADGVRWDANREFVSQGVSNLASSVSGAFPVGGSFSRSSLNRFAGARTRWSGAVTGLVILAFLPVASLLEDLPAAILGAIVVGAVANLMNPVPLLHMARDSKIDGAVAIVTFAATLLASPRVERAVVIGIVVAVAATLVTARGNRLEALRTMVRPTETESPQRA